MNAVAIPRMSGALAAVGRSLVTLRPPVEALAEAVPWSERHVADDPTGPRTAIEPMSAFGYAEDAIRRHDGHEDRLGFVGPIRPIDEAGVAQLARIAEALVDRAPTNPHIVSRRLRRADAYSPFLHAMVRSAAFLGAMSRLAGVPLMLHPHPDAAVQINYYLGDAGADAPQLARWHTDGMDYVLTLLLSERGSYRGGEFRYFRGTRAAFEALGGPPDDGRVETADFREIGEGIFSRGSAIYHGVTPVTEGRRITLVVSLFCPYFHRNDGNRFWHSAPDDGLWATLGNWYRFRAPWLGTRDFLARAGEAIPSWDEVGAGR